MNTPQPTIFHRVKNEFKIEILVATVCFLLGFGWAAKVSVGATVACLRFAVPDIVTAVLVLRLDPNRWHGVALSLLFIAFGMCRAATVALFVALGMTGISSVLGLGPGDAVLATAFTCLSIVYLFLLVIFPLTFTALLISKFTGTKLSFAHQLTRLRRSNDNRNITLDIPVSLRIIAAGSAFSLATMICSILFLYAAFPQVQAGPIVGVVSVACFILPICWIPFFAISVSPTE